MYAPYVYVVNSNQYAANWNLIKKKIIILVACQANLSTLLINYDF